MGLENAWCDSQIPILTFLFDLSLENVLREEDLFSDNAKLCLVIFPGSYSVTTLAVRRRNN